MTTNYQWLLEMDGAERKAWFDAEHVDTPKYSETTAKTEGDSRKKLEADLSDYVHEAWAQGWEAGQHDDIGCCNFYVSDMRALLDRQAAITRLESLYQFEENHRWHIRSIEEVRDLWIAKANEVREENEKLHEELEAAIASKKQLMEERDDLIAENDALTEERSKLYNERGNISDMLLTATKERDRYRDLFEMALDWGHEITMLGTSVDEGMA